MNPPRYKNISQAVYASPATKRLKFAIGVGQSPDAGNFVRRQKNFRFELPSLMNPPSYKNIFLAVHASPATKRLKFAIGVGQSPDAGNFVRRQKNFRLELPSLMNPTRYKNISQAVHASPANG
jgi:uncharacterized protein YeaC (DUF1315 family)